MNISYIRSSSYNCFDLCQHQYFLSYVLNIKQEEKISATKGTIFHKIMECLARAKKIYQEKSNATSFVDDNLGIIGYNPDYMWSWDYVNELCEKSFEYYKNKSTCNFTNADLNDIKKWCKKVVDDGKFDPRNLNVIECEQYFDLPIEKEWAILPETGNFLRVKGTIDLIIQPSDNVIEGFDWKSGRYRVDWSDMSEKDFNKLRSDPQLLIYNYALSKLYPNKNTLFTINFVNAGGSFTIPFDDSDILKAEEMLHTQLQRIQQCELPILKSDGTNFFCNKVCSYGKCCSKYNPQLTECQYFHREIVKNGIEAIVRRYSDGFNIGSYSAPGN